MPSCCDVPAQYPGGRTRLPPVNFMLDPRTRADLQDEADRMVAGKVVPEGEQGEVDYDPEMLGLGMILRDAYFSLRRCSNAHCAPLDCNGDQFVLLKLLAEQDGMTQRELVVEGGYDASTTTNMLKRLEAKGFVSRKPDPHDARAKLVFLTKKGHTHQLLLWRNSEQLRRRIWECLPKQDRATVANGLRRIATEMQQLKSELEP